MEQIQQNGQYTWAFRQDFAEFAQHCRSERQVRPAADRLLNAFGLSGMQIPIPVRSTSTKYVVCFNEHVDRSDSLCL